MDLSDARRSPAPDVDQPRRAIDEPGDRKLRRGKSVDRGDFTDIHRGRTLGYNSTYIRREPEHVNTRLVRMAAGFVQAQKILFDGQPT